MTNLVINRDAMFSYEILEHLQAGILLAGHEVKSLKQRNGSLKGAYITVNGNELYLAGAYIPAYQPNNTPESYDPYQPRKILLTKKEIAHLARKKKEAGLTLIPIKLYSNDRRIGIEVALARGKKKHDKRQTIKRRDTERDLGRTLKNRKL